ncbi:MAG: hypothetical protein QXG17_06240 [Sulfolobales archaeon]
MGDLKLLVHAYCPSSYALVRYLVDKGIHNMLEIVPLNPGSPASLSKVIPSVPALVVDSKVVAVDPIEPEFVKALLFNENIRSFVPVLEHEIVERFVKSVKSSSYVVLHVLLGGLSLGDLITSEFTDAATRTYFSGLSKDYARSVLLSRAEGIAGELLESSIRSVAYSFLRDAVISAKTEVDRFIDYEVLKLWSTAKISQGIVFTPLRELSQDGNLQRVMDYLRENYRGLLKSLDNFFSKLASDTEVYELLSKGNSRGSALM